MTRLEHCSWRLRPASVCVSPRTQACARPHQSHRIKFRIFIISRARLPLVERDTAWAGQTLRAASAVLGAGTRPLENDFAGNSDPEKKSGSQEPHEGFDTGYLKPGHI